MLAYLRVVSTYFSLGIVFYLATTKATRFIKKLNRHLSISKAKLSAYQENRIQRYLIISYIFTRWFCLLREKQADKKELEKSMHLGTIIALVDDLGDTEGKNFDQILSKVQDAGHTSDSIVLIRYLQDTIFYYCTEDFNLVYKNAIGAQDLSLKQVNEARLSEEELRLLTFDKGGYSVLLYRNILKNPMHEKEKEAVYLLGALTQLTNDLFDIYKDYQSKQQTLFTATDSLTSLHSEYRKYIHDLIYKFKNLGYSTNCTNKFLREVIVILSTGLVCFDQLLACQKSQNDKLDIAKLSRKDLVCDMARISNILKSARHSISFEHLI